MIRANNNTINFREYVESLFRNRNKLIAFNLIVFLVATAALIFVPRKYNSEAKVWIKLGRENSKLDPTASTGNTISIQENDREDEIKSVIDVIGSRGVATNAVERLGPAVVLGDEPLLGDETAVKSNPVADFVKSVAGSAIGVVKMLDPISEKEEAVQEIIKNISINSERKSNVVSVSFESDSPALAQAVVGAVIKEYKFEHNRIHTTAGSRSFFGEQRKVLKDRVSSTSEELNKAKKKFGIASIGGQQRIVEEQMAHVQRAKLDTVQNLTESRAKMDQIRLLMKTHPAKIQSEAKSVPNTGRDSLRSRLYDLQVKRMEREAKWTNHPILNAIKQQEEDAREELAAKTTMERTEKTESLNAVHQMLIIDLAQAETATAGYDAKLAALNEQEAAIHEKIDDLNTADIEVQKLQRNVQLAVTNYMTYEANFEDARVDEALNRSAISNVGIAQYPTFEEKPVSPSKILLGLATLMTMFLGSAAIVVGLPMLDNSVRRPEELETIFDAPLVASIPDDQRFSRVLN